MFVCVSTIGEFFIRNGKALRVLESECRDRGSEFETWLVWTEPENEDDE